MKKAFLLTLILCLVGFWGMTANPGMAGPKEIKIGVLFPLSGGLATTGALLRQGAELAADIANNKWPELDIPMAKWEGIPSLGGAKIKLIVMDHRSDPARGADLAKRLIDDEKVVGIMGCYNSSVTKSVSTVCERYKVPMINSNSTSPLLTRRGYNWFWRTTPDNITFTVDLFNLLKGLAEGKVRGVGKIPKEELDDLAVAGEETEYGTTGAELLKEMAPEYGCRVVKYILYPHEAPDLTSETIAMQAANPDCVAFIPYVSDAILYMRTFKSQRFSPNIIWGQNAGTVQPDFARVLGKDANGVITRTVFIPEVAIKLKPIAAQINKVFKDRTGEDLSGTSARAFTGIQTWAYVLNRAGSTELKAIQKACNEINISGDDIIMLWDGIKFGSTTPDEKGQNVLGMGMIGQWQWKDGKNVLEAIYPFDYATADMIYPFPSWK